MIQADGLIITIAVALGIAFIGGLIAARLRLPALVGYLLAGFVLGPFTPGFVANIHVAQELAEIGVILLMFGVGIHFSLRDLAQVRGIALPGALGQSAIATSLACGVALSWGWTLGNGLVLGLAISVASTIVLLRALAQRDLLNSASGRSAIGWLIVEDIFTVLVLVLLPAVAPSLGGAAGSGENPLLALVLAVGKVAALGLLVLLIGPRVVPWLLVQVAHTGSKEIFTLAVLAVALGLAVVAALVFGASLALGAFLAGVVVGQSDLSHEAAADALPLRDAFAVLFFVSVGMLFDPWFFLQEPVKVLIILGLVVVGKGLTALVIVAALGHPLRTGLIVAAGLSQVGEFSFILAELGRELDLLPGEGHSLILAAAILSITLNPLLFHLVEPSERLIRRWPKLAAALERSAAVLSRLPEGDASESLRGHAVLCGYGRVGRLVAVALERRGFRYVVIDQNRRDVEELRRHGVMALYGNAENPEILRHAMVADARALVIAITDPPVVRHIIEQARRMNPRLKIVAETQSESERAFLTEHLVDDVVFGEREVAAEMARYTLSRFGVAGPELQAIVQGLRQRGADV